MKKLFYSAVLLLVSAFIANAQDQYNQYGVKVDIDPLQAEAQDGILVLRSKNNSGYKIWFDNRVQTDGAVFFGQQKWADGISNGLSIRRARFAVKAQINDEWYGEVDCDMANGVFELKDAIIRYTGFEDFTFQVGSFKEIFSIQRNNSSRYLQFIERPMVCSALAPSRSIGFNVNYHKNSIFANLGIHGQAIESSEERALTEELSKSPLGPDEGLSYTAKFVWQPGYNKESWGLHLGAAASYRMPKTTDEGWAKTRFSTRNSTSINRKKYLDTDAIDFKYNLLYTAELAGYWKGFRGEAVYMANSTAVPEGGFKNFFGWYVQAGYLLFGGTQRYDAAGAKFTRVKRGQKWGDVELCARVENVDLNADAVIHGGSAMAYALGLNYYINDHVKVQLNYQYNDNDKYACGKSNKFAVGTTDGSTPTRVPKQVSETGSAAGINYHMVAMRFEIDF